MIDINRNGNKNTVLGMHLVKTLAEQGYRIFDTNVANQVGEQLGIKHSYINEALYHLKQNQWIVPIKRGLYSLNNTLLAGNSINEYEIAMAIIHPAAISYWSALHYHGLTDQTPHNVFVLSVTGSKMPMKCTGKDRELVIYGIHYNFLTIKKEHYFGIKEVWVGEARVNITDIERTLLDAIMKPKYCGGFAEVIESYKLAQDKIDLVKILKYARKLGNSAMRRLGWMLDYIGLELNITQLFEMDHVGYIKLNASGQNKGRYNNKWGVRENI